LANGSAPVQLDLAFGEIAARGANSTAIDGGGQKYCASGTVPNKMVAKEMAAP
jgi:hypothetical protein